jgi:hypothetical protein
MKREYKLVKTYSFEDSWTIYRKTTVFGLDFVSEIREWSDMFGKYLPVLAGKNRVELMLQAIKLGHTTYKWVPLDGYRSRALNPFKQ